MPDSAALVANKESEFARINQPRVDKIETMIGVIRKSARSQKISDEEVAALLAPVAENLAPAPVIVPVSDAAIQKAVEAGPGGVVEILPITESPHYHRIGAFVAALPVEHLTRYLSTIGDRLSEMVADAKGGGL